MEITVTIDAAAAFEKLLQIKITLNSLSVCESNFEASFADLKPFFSK